MFRPSLRTFLQLAVIGILLPAVFLIGSGCGEDEEDDDTAECGSGSDHIQHAQRLWISVLSDRFSGGRCL